MLFKQYVMLEQENFIFLAMEKYCFLVRGQRVNAQGTSIFKGSLCTQKKEKLGTLCLRVLKFKKREMGKARPHKSGGSSRY